MNTLLPNAGYLEFELGSGAGRDSTGTERRWYLLEQRQWTVQDRKVWFGFFPSGKAREILTSRCY